MLQHIGFDIETNGFLEEADRCHLLVLKNFTTGERWVYHKNAVMDSIELGLRHLQAFALDPEYRIVGHNVIKYDVPVLRKLYPWFSIPEASVVDTLVYARLLWPDRKVADKRLVKLGRLPQRLAKRHSLEAWGYRLGKMKGEYEGDPTILDAKERADRKWESWNQTMEDYCVQDVEVTEALFATCQKNHTSDVALRLELDVQWIIARQERYGFLFDEKKAAALYSKLVKRKLELEDGLKREFKPFYVADGVKTSAKTVRRQVEELGLDPNGKGKFRVAEYTEGAAYTKVKLVEFNPASRDHIGNRLQTLYGWEPMEFGDDGKPTMDDAVLAELDLPGDGVKLLREYFLVAKRIGQVAEGKEAWLKHVKSSGRIHGGVNTNGAVTGRMTHSKPNLGQVPAVYSPYGGDCRECFIVPIDKVLVGADADALELRDLAGYMAAYDAGAYIETVLRGDKKLGTDMHSVNCRALGGDPQKLHFVHIDPTSKETGRDVAKTWFYAFVYGAGDEKLGAIWTRTKGEEARQIGASLRKKFLTNLPALGKLVKAVKEKAKLKKFLRGLDGRHLEVRSQHSALNTLLQSAGAVQMKMALVILDRKLQDAGFHHSDSAAGDINYEFVANVHDEWQIECDINLGEQIGRMATDAIREAGEFFNFKCPLAGAYKVGRNWAETH